MLRCPSRNSTGAGHCWRLRRTSHRGFHQILSWHCCMLSANWHETTIERTWLFHFFLNWKQDGVILWDCNFGLLQKGDSLVTCRRVVSFHLKHFFCRCRTSCLGGMECSRSTSSASRRKGTVRRCENWWIGELRCGALHGTDMAVPWQCHVRMIPNDSNALLAALLLCFAWHTSHFQMESGDRPQWTNYLHGQVLELKSDRRDVVTVFSVFSGCVRACHVVVVNFWSSVRLWGVPQCFRSKQWGTWRHRKETRTQKASYQSGCSR